MTDQQFVNRLIELAEKLCEASKTDGVGSKAYIEVLNDITIAASRFNRSRHYRSWFAIAILVFLAVLLGLIVVKILDVIIF